MECFICGAESMVFEVIHQKGVVKACNDCIRRDNLLVVRKSFDFSYGAEKKQSVHDRLSRISGVKLGDVRKSEELKKQDADLRKVVQSREVSSGQVKVEGLVDNFHWILMRARRLRKLTQEQLAKEIGVSESVIKNAERGVLSDNYYRLINRLEIFLGIRLLKEEFRKRLQENPKEIGFDAVAARSLTISDLQEMKKKKENEIFNKKKSERNRGELSKEEMNRIIFGRK